LFNIDEHVKKISSIYNSAIKLFNEKIISQSIIGLKKEIIGSKNQINLLSWNRMENENIRSYLDLEYLMIQSLTIKEKSIELIEDPLIKNYSIDSVNQILDPLFDTQFFNTELNDLISNELIYKFIKLIHFKSQFKCDKMIVFMKLGKYSESNRIADSFLHEMEIYKKNISESGLINIENIDFVGAIGLITYTKYKICLMAKMKKSDIINAYNQLSDFACDVVNSINLINKFPLLVDMKNDMLNLLSKISGLTLIFAVESFKIMKIKKDDAVDFFEKKNSNKGLIFSDDEYKRAKARYFRYLHKYEESLVIYENLMSHGSSKMDDYCFIAVIQIKRKLKKLLEDNDVCRLRNIANINGYDRLKIYAIRELSFLTNDSHEKEKLLLNCIDLSDNAGFSDDQQSRSIREIEFKSYRSLFDYYKNQKRYQDFLALLAWVQGTSLRKDLFKKYNFSDFKNKIFIDFFEKIKENMKNGDTILCFTTILKGVSCVILRRIDGDFQINFFDQAEKDNDWGFKWREIFDKLKNLARSPYISNELQNIYGQIDSFCDQFSKDILENIFNNFSDINQDNSSIHLCTWGWLETLPWSYLRVKNCLLVNYDLHIHPFFYSPLPSKDSNECFEENSKSNAFIVGDPQNNLSGAHREAIEVASMLKNAHFEVTEIIGEPINDFNRFNYLLKSSQFVLIAAHGSGIDDPGILLGDHGKVLSYNSVIDSFSSPNNDLEIVISCCLSAENDDFFLDDPINPAAYFVSIARVVVASPFAVSDQIAYEFIVELIKNFISKPSESRCLRTAFIETQRQILKNDHQKNWHHWACFMAMTRLI
jgi:hypothetical protein